MRPVPDFQPGRQPTALRVLLLEDDEAFAGLARANLERVDWAELSLEWVSKLADALARLDGGGFDLVITDLNLPDSKGLDTLESLVRATDRLILVLTGDDDPGLREAAIEQGAYDLMSKDRIDRTELERLVRLAAMQAKTFRSLRKSEERYRSLMELSADWYWEQDADLRFVATGGATDARAGITPEAHVGKCRWDLPSTEILNQTWDEHRSVLQARQPFHDLLLRRAGANNETRYVSVSGSPIFGEQRSFCGYRGVAKDVTTRVRTDLRLAIEHSVTRLLGESNSIAEAAPQIIRVVCETLGWACGARWEHDERNQLMLCAETWGVASAGINEFLEAARRRPAPLAQPGGLNRRAWVEGKPMWIRDVTQEASFRRAPEAAKAGLHSAFAFPIKLGTQVIGVMEFFSREIHQPDAELLECMTYVGSQIGQFMQRKRAEEEQRRFRAAIDVSADLVLLVDPASMLYVDANETACRTLGYSREELLAMGPHQFLFASREDLTDLYARLIAGDQSAMTTEGWCRRKDGSQLFIESFRRAVPSAKGHVIVVVVRDIGERRRAEQLLKLEHTVTRALAEADNMPAALKAAIRAVCETEGWECGRYLGVDDKAGVLRFAEAWSVSDANIERYIESSRAMVYGPGVGVVGRVWQSGEPIWVPDITKDARVARTALAQETGMGGAFAVPVLSEGKTIGVLIFHSRELRAPDERLLQAVRVIGSQIGQFVQRKQAEEVRRESEERFRSLTGLSSDWYWEQDEKFRFTLISSAAKDATGRGPLSNIGKTRWDLPALNMTEADWAAHRALLEARQPFYDLELHRRTAEGKSKYTSISGEPVFDAAGVFKGYRGVGRDITGRKRAEQLVMLEHTVTRALAEADSAPAALEAAIRNVCETEGWECGRYFRPDDKADVLRLGAAWGVPIPEIERYIAGSREIVYAPGVGLIGLVWQTGQPMWVPDLYEDARTSQAALAHGSGIHGAFCFPVVSEGKTIGVLAFNSREVREPEERLLQAIHVIGSQIGQFVQRKQAEEVRRESEERFRSLTKLSSDFYWETDAGHRMMQTHYAGQHQPVIPRGQRFGKTRWEVPSTHPDVAGWAAHRATLEAHLPFRDFEVARIDDRGVERYLSISGEPMFDAEGLFKGYRGVGKDITPRKQAEERQATHTRYQEKIARFGASALGKREASDLIEDALQNVVEALPATVVVYVEPGGGERELVMRGCAGLAAGEPAAVACYGKADAVARALEHGELAIVDRPVSGAALLPFGWAAAFRRGALVPVHGDNRVQGALCVLAEGPGAFGAEESKFLVTVASVLSAGLRRIDSEGRLAFLAQFDALTGLPNRALLSDRFSQLIVQARRHATQLGVLFIDLDDFKLVNDSLGHAGGDELLKEAARRLQSAVRAGDTVARISGDEFAVILTDLARPDDAALVAQKIIDRLAAPMQVRGQEVFVTASIGIAAFPADGGDAESLLGAADAAMYRAKQAGRNGYQFFTAEINQRTRARAQLGSELRRALEREEFALVYQPKYDLQTGRPCAVEALLRWNHPERGVVSPVEFIPVLEETGLIVAVGEWVLQRACENLKSWQAEGAVVVPIAVNLSARQFRQQDLDQRLIGLVKAAGVEPKLIELEITESQLMQDPDHAIRVMRSLSDAGIRIAIDDFGTGYSSLSYLTRFPVAALKIDRSFVADVLSDQADAAIVRTIIDMAHTLGSIVIAEGVETEAQAALLRSLGCEQAQGYFFARPMPEADLKVLLSSYEKRPPRKARAASRAR